MFALTRVRAAIVLALVVVAACAFVYPWSDQDGSRLALTQAVANFGTLRIDRWAFELHDKAFYGGHWYTDKTPGLSFLALPTYSVLRALGDSDRSWSLWVLRLLTGGVAFAAMVLIVHAAAERLVPRSGLLTATALGAGTFAFSLAPTSFSHLAAGACGLGAFLLLMRRASTATVVAGLVAGAAVLFDYLAAMTVVVLAAYVVLTTRSPRRLLLFAASGVPAAAALAAYDQFAFGGPWRLSYRYVVGDYGSKQSQGLFGSARPTLAHLDQMLLASRGILLTSPILIVAVAGLVLLVRRGHRAEAAACLAIVALFVTYTAGYFDPTGGTSPGPRFLGAALPFAILGLAPLAVEYPRLIVLLVVCSTATSLADAVQWAWASNDVNWLFTTMPPAIAALVTAGILAPALALAATNASARSERAGSLRRTFLPR